MAMKILVTISLIIFAHFLNGQSPTFEIRLEEEDLVDLNHWVDQDGFILIDASFETHNHYFYLLNPDGEVISQYKNYYQNLFHKGLTSNTKEFTIYFSKTPNGEVQFLDFFKDGSRPPITTSWANVPKDSPDQSINVGGTLYYLFYDKKKSQLMISSFDGPATDFKITYFSLQKELAKDLLKSGFRGVDLNNFFTPDFGSGVTSISDDMLIALVNQNDRWTRYLFDFSQSSVKIDTHNLPDLKDVINYRSGAFICDNKIFLVTLNVKKACLQVMDLNYEMLKDECYDESTGIDFKASGLLSFGGRPIDEKWSERDNYNAKFLERMARETYGYINVYHHPDNYYSIKMGGQSPATSGGSTMVPSAGGGWSPMASGGSPASTSTFNGNLSTDLNAIERSNIFNQILEKTEMQFNIPYYGQKKFIALSKNYYYKVEWNFKGKKLDVFRYELN